MLALFVKFTIENVKVDVKMWMWKFSEYKNKMVRT